MYVAQYPAAGHRISETILKSSRKCNELIPKKHAFSFRIIDLAESSSKKNEKEVTKTQERGWSVSMCIKT